MSSRAGAGPPPKPQAGFVAPRRSTALARQPHGLQLTLPAGRACCRPYCQADSSRQAITFCTQVVPTTKPADGFVTPATMLYAAEHQQRPTTKPQDGLCNQHRNTTNKNNCLAVILRGAAKLPRRALQRIDSALRHRISTIALRDVPGSHAAGVTRRVDILIPRYRSAGRMQSGPAPGDGRAAKHGGSSRALDQQNRAPWR